METIAPNSERSTLPGAAAAETRANNDLSNLQLELARKNAELTREMVAREQAEASLQFLGSAVEQATESILITDAQVDLPGPRIIFVNPAFTKMTGYSAEDAIGKTPRILQGPRTDRGVLDRLRKNIERGEEFLGTTINYRKDGTEFNIEWHLAPVRDAHGKITHFVSVQRDISERVRTASALQKANAERLELSHQAGMAEVATNVLHNVGNVLNSVSISAEIVTGKVRQPRSASLKRVAELLREHAHDLPDFLTRDPQGRELPAYLLKVVENLAEPQKGILEELESLRKNIEHIKEIVAMQQTFARSTRMIEPLMVEELVEDAIRINTAGFTRHDVNLVREIAPLPPLLSDRHKVLQILVNLLSNANYALNDAVAEKRLIVRAALNGSGELEISVADNGVGIAPENLDRIFNHGFTTKQDGHGFGLHSAGNAAKQLGGRLTVLSEGPGRGATFILKLPLEHKTESL